MLKWIDAKLTSWAVNRISSRTKGFVLSSGPTVYDPMGLIGGWIYGDDWRILFASDKCKSLVDGVIQS